MDIPARKLPAIVLSHLAVVIAYVVTAKLVLLVFAANGVVSIVWPPSGIALVALMLGGRTYIPSVWFAAFLACLWAGNAVPVSLGIALGNTLEAVVAAEILRLRCADCYLDRPRDYFCIAGAGSIASVLAAGVGVASLWQAGHMPAGQIAGNFLHWWQGDVLGIVLVTPLLLVWRTLPRGWFRRERLAETLIFFPLTFLFGQAVFMHWFDGLVGKYAQPYWMFLFVAWASVRFGRHGVLLVIFITAWQHLAGILHDVGRVDVGVTETLLQNFWFYMLVLTLVGLALSLIIHQRRRDQDHLVSMQEQSRQALHTLHESEERHRILFEYSKDALVTTEPPLTRFTSGNREAIAMFGVKDESELTRYGPLDFAPEYQPDGRKSIDRAAQVVDQALSNGYSYFEWVHRRINGEEFPCSILLTAVTISGKVVLQAAIRDITAKKEAEQKLLELNERLEQKVEERTRQLDVARHQAEAMAHEKGEFLASMSHEIRVPISSVLGMSYLALKTRLNDKQRDYVEKIQVSAQHLLGLIDSILDFSKLEAGQVALERIDFTLSQVIDTMNSVVLEKAAEKQLGVVVNIDENVPVDLTGDPLRLAQILINYVNNAIKFSERGDIVVHVSLLDASGAGVMLRFEVIDQGIGVPLDEQAHLFESFRQGDPSIARKYGGSGLGLAICKQLADMMGGQVGMASAPGKGSTFWFTAMLGLASSPHEATRSDNEKVYRAKLAGARILVAEDNPINRQVAAELLELLGAKVSLADTGRQALEQVRAQPFDCVLMDVQMPDMDGIQATQAIRADRAISNTVIIAMTANAWSEDQQRCLAAGMDDFVSKPVKPAHLYAIVAKWLGGKSDNDNALPLPTPSPSRDRAGSMIACDDPAIIDLGILAECLGNDSRQLREFVEEKFLPSTRLGLAEMQQALDSGNRTILATLGHKYKSSAKTVGAMGFADLCLAMEKLPEQDWQASARELLQQMQELLARVDSAIKAR